MHIEDDAGETDNPKDAVDSVTKQISGIAISESLVVATSSTDATDNSKSESSAPDIDKKIRALKKKVVFLSPSLPPSLSLQFIVFLGDLSLVGYPEVPK